VFLAESVRTPKFSVVLSEVENQKAPFSFTRTELSDICL
jgi:hypothetical protein